MRLILLYRLVYFILFLVALLLICFESRLCYSVNPLKLVNVNNVMIEAADGIQRKRPKREVLEVLKRAPEFDELVNRNHSNGSLVELRKDEINATTNSTDSPIVVRKSVIDLKATTTTTTTTVPLKNATIASTTTHKNSTRTASLYHNATNVRNETNSTRTASLYHNTTNLRNETNSTTLSVLSSIQEIQNKTMNVTTVAVNSSHPTDFPFPAASAESVNGSIHHRNVQFVSKTWYPIKNDNTQLSIRSSICIPIVVTDSMTFNPSGPVDTVLAPLKMPLFLICLSLVLLVAHTAVVLSTSTDSCLYATCIQLIQVVICIGILINLILFRSHWEESWKKTIKVDEAPNTAPIYPFNWKIAEVLTVLCIVEIIIERLTRNVLSLKVRCERSQGVYKCIQREQFNKSQVAMDEEIGMNSFSFS